MANVQITISVIETDGDLSVTLQAPAGSSDTIAYALAEKLLVGANELLNSVFNQSASITEVTNQ